MSEQKIVSVNIEAGEELNKALAGAVDANQNLRAHSAEIQKRGFVYRGDTSNSFGLGNGRNATGFVGGAPFYGRGLELQLGGFSLQPFGIGQLGQLAPGFSQSLTGSTVAGKKNFSKTTNIAHIKMAMAVEAYKGFGIIKNVIDLMCNFASEGLKIIHPRPAIKKFYERWAEAVDLQGRIKHILRYYYKWGNVFIYTIPGRIDGKAYQRMRSTRGTLMTYGIDTNDPAQDERNRDIEDELTKPLEEREIPWRYKLLNPLQMDKRGTKFFGEDEWVFIMDEETLKEIKAAQVRSGNIDVLDDTEVGLPKEFKKLLEEKSNVVALDQARLWTLHYMKDDHEDWADPMVWPVMNDVIYKNRLRAMDQSVIDSTINAITIFKLGDIKAGFIAPQQHYTEFSQMLRTPTYSHNIVWNDAIEMESNYPPIEKILGVEKYRSVDRDILSGLGIPSILVDGAEGGSFSNAFLQVRTLLERLEEGRREVMKWVNKQLRIVAEVMGHRDIPFVKFGSMSLKDEQAEKQLIIQLLDRNVISVERVHEVFDIEYLVELERMRMEKSLVENEDLLMKFGPYTDPMNMMDQEETMEKQFDQDTTMEKLRLKEQKVIKQQQMRQQQKNRNAGPNGRPGGTKNIKQEKKRKTKPKGMGLGSMVAFATNRIAATTVYEDVEKTLTDKMLHLKEAKYKKALSKKDREDLDNLVYLVYSNIEDFDDYNIEDILSGLSVNEEYDSCVDSIRAAYGSTLGETRMLRIEAMALYTMGEGNAE